MNSPIRLTASLFAGLALALALSGRSQPKAPARSIEYRNAEFDFCFSLPAAWTGYSTIDEEWKGGAPGSEPTERGPLIRIRHPHWTEADPYEDIPIMIFTRAQWRKVEKDELVVSAAPVGPTKLGENSKFVFALPPRYNFDQQTGWEQVEYLVGHHSLHAPCVTKTIHRQNSPQK